MNPNYYTTTHVTSSEFTYEDANQTVKNIFGILKRGDDLINLNDIPETSGNLNICESVVIDNLSDIKKQKLLNVVNKIDDPFKRRPFIPVIETTGISRHEEPVLIIYVAEWAGRVTSIDYESERYLVNTVYNNIFVENLISGTGPVYCGFILDGAIIITSGLTDTVASEDLDEVFSKIVITLQKKIQTIYLEYEYPYLMNGTINENVYSWSDPNKLTSFLPITNIYLYDENGKALSLTSLSEPIKKTIAQNLKVRIRYDI